ncbi:hypothetical protein KEM54_006533 [Ascosphaera aggregata]|nr:hypothetical protein KEM54_006533 [Ascosphaera aggregata]
MSPSSSKIPIFFLKTLSVPDDPYEKLVSEVQKTEKLPSEDSQYTYDPTFVPVLEHWYNDENLNYVNALVASGELARKYEGLIFTSVRATEGFSRMVRALVDESHFPHAKLLGKEAGTGKNLAHFIQEHYRVAKSAGGSEDARDTRMGRRRLLFLAGEKHRDDIPRILMDSELPPEERIHVDELVVYKTGVMNLFPDDFAHVLYRAKQRSKVIWVVVFSPTGCEAMLRVLRRGPYRAAEAESDEEDSRCFIATIGPTTRDFLKEKYDVDVEVCAETPDPAGVKNGIEKFMKEHGI